MQKYHSMHIRILSRYSNTCVTERIYELTEYLFQPYEEAIQWYIMNVYTSNKILCVFYVLNIISTYIAQIIFYSTFNFMFVLVFTVNGFAMRSITLSLFVADLEH